MKTKRVNIAFFVTLGVSLIVFIYLVFLGYDEIKTFKDIIKIVAAILFPIPILFFVRFILIKQFIPLNTNEYKLKNQKPATLLLIVSMLAGLILLHSVEWITNQKLENNLIFAHLINSTTITSYVLNYILYNNLRANGILSGVLLALALYIFF